MALKTSPITAFALSLSAANKNQKTYPIPKIWWRPPDTQDLERVTRLELVTSTVARVVYKPVG